eukprot:TRINITY_DN9037_c0_g1_i1.p1 TRINITY_DN9037_c0_g1~~TRINITY_DN9037_c0_g1_i1.p1  ORF type:complete len:166 (+),score=77.54 TRINITY_DN9037_c0_g1_i1:270-767(+)
MEENKPKGPITLDHDDIEWLESKENEAKLKKLETELEVMKELETFNKEVQSKIYQVTNDPNDDIPSFDFSKPKSSATNSSSPPVEEKTNKNENSKSFNFISVPLSTAKPKPIVKKPVVLLASAKKKDTTTTNKTSVPSSSSLSNNNSSSSAKKEEKKVISLVPYS